MNDRRTPTIPSVADNYRFVVHELDDFVVLVCFRGRRMASIRVKNDWFGRDAAMAWFMEMSLEETPVQLEENLSVVKQIAEIGR